VELGLLTETFPNLVVLQKGRKDHFGRLEALQAPELTKVVMLEEDYLCAIIKSIEPSLRVDGYATVALAMSQDPSRAILANSGWLHDALLVGDHSHRAVGDHADSALKENDVVLVEIFDVSFTQIFHIMVPFESLEEWFILKDFMDQ
jgi:hypothetical protein